MFFFNNNVNNRRICISDEPKTSWSSSESIFHNNTINHFSVLLKVLCKRICSKSNKIKPTKSAKKKRRNISPKKIKNRKELPRDVSLAKPPMKILLEKKSKVQKTYIRLNCLNWREKEREERVCVPRTGAVDFIDAGFLWNHGEI